MSEARTARLSKFLRHLSGAGDNMLSPQARRVLEAAAAGGDLGDALTRAPVLFSKMIKAVGFERIENMGDLHRLRQGDPLEYQKFLERLNDMDPDALARGVGISPDALRRAPEVHAADVAPGRTSAPEAPTPARTQPRAEPRGPAAGSPDDLALRQQLDGLQDQVDALRGKARSLAISRNIHRSMIAAGGVPTALILTEYLSGGALSSGAVDLTFAIVKELRDMDWHALADFVEKNGLDAIQTLGDIMDTPRDAVVNATARGLEKTGHHDDAAMVRISNVIFKADFLLSSARIMADANVSDKDKGEAIARHVIEESGVPRERVESLLLKRPEVIAALNPDQRRALMAAFPSLQGPMAEHEALYARGDQTRENVRARVHSTVEGAKERGRDVIGRIEGAVEHGGVSGAFLHATGPSVQTMRTNLTSVANGAFRNASGEELSAMVEATSTAVNNGQHANNFGFFDFIKYALGFKNFDHMGLTEKFNAYADLANYMAKNPVIAWIADLFVDLPDVNKARRLALDSIDETVPTLLAKLPAAVADAGAGEIPPTYKLPAGPSPLGQVG